MTTFNAETQITRELSESDRSAMITLGAIAGLCIAVPVLLKPVLPQSLRLGLLGMAPVASIGLTAMAYGAASEARQREHQRYSRISESLNKAELTHAIALQNVQGEIAAKMRLAMLLQNLPAEARYQLGQQYGVLPFLQFPERTIPMQAEAVTMPASPGSVSAYQYTPPEDPEPHQGWLEDLVQKFAEADENKRVYAHLIVNGPTRSGKSTLVSKLLEMMGSAIAANGQHCEFLLIDPKYPMTRWPIPATFTGFANVEAGLLAARDEFWRRKALCVEAKKQGKPFPEFSRLIVVVDEQDSIYAEGKGHPELGSDPQARKDVAQNIHAIEVNLLKEAAAYGVSLFIVGQSPLSGATGFSRSDMQQACRIVLGNIALNWLQDAQFPFKDEAPALADELKYWLGRGDRAALICPNNGAAYVEAIPDLSISEMIVDSPVAASNPETQDPIAVLRAWVEALGRTPSDAELLAKAGEVLGVELTENALRLLKDKLGL